MARKEKKEEGAPLWVVTYGDMMSLLLCFFVMLVSMSELKRDVRYKEVMESIRIAFGYKGGLGRVPTREIPEISVIKKLMNIVIPDEIKTIGDSKDPGIEGKVFRVTQVRESWKLTFGGALQFERFSDRLLPGREKILEEFTGRVKGLTNIIDVLGHTTLESIPPNSPFKDKDDLALARARRVRNFLVDYGVDPKRIRLVSCADHEPLLRQAYSEERLARNRRVEIIVSDALLGELEGKKLAPNQR